MQHQQPCCGDAHERGAALLATTLAITLILVATGAAMVSAGVFEGFIAYTHSNSYQAYEAARAGGKDALLRIARNRLFTSAGYTIPAGCTMNGSSLCTTVVVEKDAASSCSQAISAGQDCIIATGTLGTISRTVEITLSVNAANGKISQVSWKER